jgi:ParB family chromosome partitioning protein
MECETIQYLKVAMLVVLPQVRKRVNRDGLNGLTETVRRLGVKIPIRVRREGDRFIVVDGHLRLLAAKAAGLETVPCIIEEKHLSEAEVCEVQLILNRRREDLSPVEFAEAVHRLMQETQWKASEAAQRLGESPATISRHLKLLELPADIRARVESGEISASAGYKLTQVDDAAQQQGLAAEVAAGNLTRDGLNGKLNGKQRKPSRAKRAKKAPRVTVPLGGGRTITFAGSAIERVGMLIAWLEELLCVLKAQPTDCDVSALVELLRRRSRGDGEAK